MKDRIPRLAVIALVGTAFLATPVLAQSQSRRTPTRLPSVEVTGVPTVRISYSDLDTASPEGMAILSSRVSSAAASVCRFSSGQLQEAFDEFACQQTAKISAWDQFAANEEVSYAEAPPQIELTAVRPSNS